jgi:hypothetical protein
MKVARLIVRLYSEIASLAQQDACGAGQYSSQRRLIRSLYTEHRSESAARCFTRSRSRVRVLSLSGRTRASFPKSNDFALKSTSSVYHTFLRDKSMPRAGDVRDQLDADDAANRRNSSFIVYNIIDIPERLRKSR